MINYNNKCQNLQQLTLLGGHIGYTIFVRFGMPPKNGKSKNHLTGDTETGVSVYEAIVRKDKISIIMPCLTYSACVSLSGCIERQAYEVVGNIIGTGSDGEPIIKNCKIIRKIEIV